MKIAAFIIAFLVLALSLMPCADKGNVMEEGRERSELTKTSQQQDNTQKDDCSPFCHCACCAGFSINHSVTSVVIIPAFSDSITNNFLSPEVIEVAFPIWQPPRSC